MEKHNGEYVHRESSDEFKDHITQVTINDAAERGAGTIQFPTEKVLIEYKEDRGDENCS